MPTQSAAKSFQVQCRCAAVVGSRSSLASVLEAPPGISPATWAALPVLLVMPVLLSKTSLGLHTTRRLFQRPHAGRWRAKGSERCYRSRKNCTRCSAACVANQHHNGCCHNALRGLWHTHAWAAYQAAADTRCGLLGCVVQLAYSPVTFLPVRTSTSPGSSARMVMHSGTGQIATHRLQPAPSASLISNLRTPPSLVKVMAWCEVSSHTTWQRPHWMQASLLMTAFSMWLRLRFFQSLTVGTAWPLKSSKVA